MTASASHRSFLGISALIFAASTATTIVWGAAMTEMGAGVPMPGGWVLSMAWMPMCEQTWPQAAASFLGMWLVMMVAMMLPSLTPMLLRYRQAVGGSNLDLLTAIVGLGYFLVWTLLGIVVFPLGAAMTELVQLYPGPARAVPVATGMVVLGAGALQFSAWKARHLACCRTAPKLGDVLPARAGSALRHGVRLGLHCCYSCAGLTAILLVLGVMDLQTMAVVAAAIALERLAPAGRRIAQAIGGAAIGAGVFLIAQSLS